MKRLLCVLLPGLAAPALSQTYKLDWEQNILPAQSAATVPVSVEADPAGNAYVVGNWKTTEKPQRIFLAKFASNGKRLWMKSYSSSKGCYATSLAIDAAGNAFVAGSIRSSGSGWDGLLLRYSADGILAGSSRFDGAAHKDDSAVKVAIDSIGGAYVAGRSRNAHGDFDATICRVDSTAAIKWSRVYDGGSWDEAVDLCVGPSDQVVVASSSENGGNFDVLLFAYTPSGDFAWKRLLGDHGVYAETATSIALAPDGNVLVAGRCYQTHARWDFLAAKVDIKGNTLWQRHYGGPYDDLLQTMKVSSAGAIYLAGSYQTSLQYQGFNIAVMKLGSDGTLRWKRVVDASPGKDDEGMCGTVTANDGFCAFGRSQDATSREKRLAVLGYSPQGNGSFTETDLNRTPANSEEPLAATTAKDGAIYLLGTKKMSDGRSTEGWLLRILPDR